MICSIPHLRQELGESPISYLNYRSSFLHRLPARRFFSDFRWRRASTDTTLPKPVASKPASRSALRRFRFIRPARDIRRAEVGLGRVGREKVRRKGSSLAMGL